MEAAPAGSAPPSPLAALSYRDFRFYAAARFLATLAVQMQGAAVGFQVYALTHRKIDLAYLGLAQFVPIIGLSIVAGQLADRLDRRRILVVCDVVFACAAVAFWRLAHTPAPSFHAILAILAVVGAARAFYGPSGSSLLPFLVPREHFTNAVTWQSMLWQGAAIGGPSLAGAIYGVDGRARPRLPRLRRDLRRRGHASSPACGPGPARPSARPPRSRPRSPASATCASTASSSDPSRSTSSPSSSAAPPPSSPSTRPTSSTSARAASASCAAPPPSAPA